jgi:hypothetical protein
MWVRTGSPMLNAGGISASAHKNPCVPPFAPVWRGLGLPKACEGRWAQCEGLEEAPAHRALAYDPPDPDGRTPRPPPDDRAWISSRLIQDEGWRCGLAMPRPRRNRGAIGEVGAQDGCMFGGLPDRAGSASRLAKPFVILNRRGAQGLRPSLAFGLPVSLPPKLRVTGAQRQHVPIYLRTSFRLLFSRVH